MNKYLILAVGIVVIAGGTYVSRDILKGYFVTGDKPTQGQFGDLIDSALNIEEDGLTTDAKTQNPTKKYDTGDTVVKSEPIYQAKVLTQTQTEFTLNAVQPVTFRWTPVVPNPQEPVTYRLKVWQLMQGQNGSQAMKINQPIVTKDVADITEVTLSSLYTGPCIPPYLCDFVWGVEAMTSLNSENTESAAEPSTGAR